MPIMHLPENRGVKELQELTYIAFVKYMKFIQYPYAYFLITLVNLAVHCEVKKESINQKGQYSFSGSADAFSL